MNTQVDLMANGQAQGGVAGHFAAHGKMDAGMLRPYLYTDPKTGHVGVYVTTFKGGDPKKPENYVSQQLNVNAMQANGVLRS